jgi:hypothetical protein
MNTVITEKQARQITGGRMPLLPVEYEEAVKAIAACVDLDETKYWSDKADALAAWAKIYRDDAASIAAKRLKIRAYHRMGVLAKELRPGGYVKGKNGLRPGAQSLLIEKGLSKSRASQALCISTARPDELANVVEKARGISTVARTFRGRVKVDMASTDAWAWLTRLPGAALFQVRSAMRSREARAVAAAVAPREIVAARKVAVEIMEWLDQFEQYLPK